MKKVFLSTILLSTIGFAFYSCKKENVSQKAINSKTEGNSSSMIEDTANVLLSLNFDKSGNQNLVFDQEFGVTEAMGMLVFRSSQEYWNAVQTEDQDKLDRFINLIENMSFISFEKSIIRDQTKKDTLYTGLMPKMINDKEIIIIGKNIYKIDMFKEKVFTMPAAAINELNDLQIQNALNKKIKAYSTHDDVIDIVENKIGCGESCAPNKNPTRSGKAGYGGKEFEFEMKIKYFHFGIGTDMDTRVDIKNQVTVTSTYNTSTGKWETIYTSTAADDVYLYGVMFRRYKIKCGSESAWTLLPPEYNPKNS